MYRVVKTCYLDMAHRIKDHKGKCRFLHGHTWMIELSLSNKHDNSLDELGILIDFGVIKQKFFDPIQRDFDHSCILSKGDDCIEPGGRLIEDLNICYMDFKITAETLAKYFYEFAVSRFKSFSQIHVDYVRVYEQLHPTISYAEYSLKS